MESKNSKSSSNIRGKIGGIFAKKQHNKKSQNIALNHKNHLLILFHLKRKSN